ncbi:MAG: PKD domain-containing protein [Saprospiraceae bacterium]
MKNLLNVLIIAFLFFSSSCKKEEVKLDVNFEPNPTTDYKNDGPLSKVSKICDVLSFDDEAHFREVYHHLESRYDANEATDSTASLDAFENELNFESRRTFVNDWETNMEDSGIPIDETNDIDTIFFEDDILKTMLNPNAIMKIGGDAVLMIDDCLWIRVPFQDCQGVKLLEQFSIMLAKPGREAQEATMEFAIQNNIVFEDLCPSPPGSRSSGCGFQIDFTYTDPVINPSTGRYEFTLTDLTHDYLANSQLRRWKIVGDNSVDTMVSKFETLFGGQSSGAESPTVSVPSDADYIIIRLKKRTLRPYCAEYVEKKIYLACPSPDWHYVDMYTVQFTTRNYSPGMSTDWNFGDGNTSTAINPTHTYSVSCLENFNANFNVYSAAGGVCQIEFPVIPITVGPKDKYIKHKKAKGWKTVGNEKFKWMIKANGTPSIIGIDLGFGKVKGKIKYKKKNGSGKWKKKKTNLTIRFENHTYEVNNCSILNDLATVSSPKIVSNKKKTKNKYKTSTPFRIFLDDPIQAYFSAGGINGTFDVFD